MTGQGALRVDSLRVQVGARLLLDGVSFEAAPAEVIGIVGPNGAGKSTLLETLVGLRLPAAGTISKAGKQLSRFSDFAATFAFLPDGGEPRASNVPYDWSEARRQSLPPAAVAGLQALQQPITIDLFLDRDDSRRRQIETDVLAKLELARPDAAIRAPLDRDRTRAAWRLD